MKPLFDSCNLRRMRMLIPISIAIFAVPPVGHAQTGSTVDPTLVLSTYFGGDGRESATNVAVDAQGNVFALGNSAFGSLDPGGAESIRHVPPPPAGLPPGFDLPTDPDVMLVKFAPDLTSAEYFAIIGGTGRETAVAMSLDAEGRPVILLTTESTDFPTKNPIHADLEGNGDFALIKLSADGKNIVFSTYLGIGDDFSGLGFGGTATDLALDGAGAIYVCGSTSSAEFPVTDGAFQRETGAGTPNGFVVKIAADGSESIYATYLGGSGTDFCRALAVDEVGNAFVAGTTTSPDFPLVQPLNAVRGPAVGGIEREQLFLAKLKADGSALEFSTFLIGGGDVDALALTPDGGVVMAGRSGGGLTVSANALQSEVTGGFVLELNPGLTAVAFASRLGGASVPFDVIANADGGLAITGSTTSQALATTHGEFGVENDFNTSADAFAVKLDPSRNVIYSVRFGGLDTDEGHGIGFLPDGDLVIAGLTKSFDFPLVEATREFPIGDDAFLTRIGETPSNGGGGTLETHRYTDRTSANVPGRFYRIREQRP